MNNTHIVLSGMNKSLCGKENAQGTSLGWTCTCDECMKIAEKIMGHKND